MGPIFDPQNYEFSVIGLPRALIAFFGLLVPFYLYLKNRGSTIYRIYFLAVVPAFLWQFGYAWMMQARTEPLARFWSGIGQIGTYFIPPAIYGFSVLHVRARRQLPVLLAAFIMSMGFSLFLYHPLLFQGMKRYSWGFYNIHGPLHVLEIIFLAAATFGFFFNLIRDFRSTASLQQKKLDWFLIVAFGCALLGILEFLPGYGFDVRPLGFLAVSVWSIFILWGTLYYRTTDLERIIAQTFSYLLISLCVLMVFVGFTAIAQRVLIGAIDWTEILVTGLALLAIFPMASFGYRQSQKRLAKAFYQQRLRAHETLREFNEQLKDLTNCKLLVQELVFTLRGTIGVEKTAVYLRTPGGQSYLLNESAGEDPGLISLVLTPEINSYLKAPCGVLSRTLLSDDSKPSDKEIKAANFLEQIGYELVVGLVINQELIGFLALGKRNNGKCFDVSDIELLQVVGKNSAVAISNAMLFAELSEKNQTLVKIDREKTHFLANTAHELKTPLHGILGITESLMDGVNGDLNQDQKYYVKLIHDSGRALADLVEKLLNLERMEARRTECEIIRFKIKDLVDMVVPIIEGVLREKKDLSLQMDIPNDLEVYGDIGLVRQVLLNLLGNSAKFTAAGTIKLSAWKGNGVLGKRQSMAEEADRFVTLSVTDTGIGIRPEDQGLIFQPFQQADGSIKKIFGGSGLGLSIVKKILDLHQGRIWVDSEPGRGSSFYFTLPQFPFSVNQKEAEAAESESVKKVVVDASGESRHPVTADRLYKVSKAPRWANYGKGKGEKILVVDDNESNVSLTCLRLEVSGYEPYFARSAEEAWKWLNDHPIDLVVLDVMMPGINGYEFCQKMRRNEGLRRIPIIMVTAKATLEDKVYGLHVGADDYLSKPFNSEELSARVHTLLRMKRFQDELLQKNREAKTISEITSVINKEIELDRLLLTILDKMMELVGAERGCILTLDDESRDVNLRFSRGFRSQKRSDVIKAISQGVIQTAVEKGEILVVSDLEAEKDRMWIEQAGSLICLPLRTREKIYGCLYLYSQQKGQLHESLLRFLVPIGQQMSYSIYNAKLYDLAITDDLTRLYLKRHFMEVLQLECERGKNQALKFSLIMIDIDFFKSFNDSYGHQMGDSVLVQVTELLQDSCRMSDVAARYGGEEFIVLLRNTELREAQAFAERYRKMVENYRIFHRGKGLHLTVSAGVCGFEMPNHLSPDEMITLVDFELYRAKAAGRNCVSSLKIDTAEGVLPQNNISSPSLPQQA